MRTLILGIGNLLLCDEGVGVHVVRALQRERLPENTVTLEVGTAFLEALPEIELADFGIHVIDVCPGYVKTRFQENVLAGTPPPLDQLRQRWALTPEQVADAVYLLCLPEAAMISIAMLTSPATPIAALRDMPIRILRLARCHWR